MEIYGEHGAFVYHYTTANAAFALILPNGALRFSRLANMRDPVENKDWVQAVLPPPAWSKDDIQKFERIAAQVVFDTRVLSLTLDSEPIGRHPEHARGYARPRMWEQYADNHQGVCLVFDQVRLKAQIELELASYRRRYDMPVVYNDDPLDRDGKARSLDGTDIAATGRGDYRRGLEAHLEENHQELFFRKLADWRAESEYRFVVIDDGRDEILVSYGDALCAVILGERFPPWQLPAAAVVSEAAAIDLRQIRWGAFPPRVFDPCAEPLGRN